MVDNKTSIAIAQNTNSKDRYKYIDTWYKFIQENMLENKIQLEYIKKKC